MNIKIYCYEVITAEAFSIRKSSGVKLYFKFYLDENKHLHNVKLLGKEVVILGDKYLVKKVENVIIEDDGKNRKAYTLLVEEI